MTRKICWGVIAALLLAAMIFLGGSLNSLENENRQIRAAALNADDRIRNLERQLADSRVALAALQAAENLRKDEIAALRTKFAAAGNSGVQERRLRDAAIQAGAHKISMVFDNADIRDVINTIAIQGNFNVVVGPEVTGRVSIRLESVPCMEALNTAVRTLDFVAVREANTIRITSPTKATIQLETRVFKLVEAKPAETFLGLLKNVKSVQGTISIDKGTNTLIVRDTTTVLDAMQEIIDNLDMPQRKDKPADKPADKPGEDF